MIDHAYFVALADSVCALAQGHERILLNLSAESSNFLRFNRGAVRQATHVDQVASTISLVSGKRRLDLNTGLTGQLAEDCKTLISELDSLRARLADVAEDPYLLLPESASSSHRHDPGVLPAAAELIDAVAQSASGLDFVGFYAGGPVFRAFADSLGSRHWHHVESFQFSWCVYASGDKAVKSSYGGTQWSLAEFARRVAEDAQRSRLLARPVKRLQPGAYRAYFAPAAVAELLELLSWSGFGIKSRRSGGSSLEALVTGRAHFSERVSLSQDVAAGVAPRFTSDGFTRPDRVDLVVRGQNASALVSPRSAQEFGVPANGASATESPDALRLGKGDLRPGDVLARLGTGIWVSNLWYLNYSDRAACQMTGMTRFACMWVENGELVAPLEVMRFDDALLRMLGDGLVALTDQAELIPDGSTYGQRQLASVTTPGALVEGWRLTL